jgi:hypothetical protein
MPRGRAIARHLLEKDNVPSEHLSIHAGQAGLVIKGKNGQCRNEYRWSGDESEVQVAVTVSSPLLPAPLNYLLDYRRPCTTVE